MSWECITQGPSQVLGSGKAPLKKTHFHISSQPQTWGCRKGRQWACVNGMAKTKATEMEHRSAQSSLCNSVSFIFLSSLQLFPLCCYQPSPFPLIWAQLRWVFIFHLWKWVSKGRIPTAWKSCHLGYVWVCVCMLKCVSCRCRMITIILNRTLPLN